jgi:hypothetical protein
MTDSPQGPYDREQPWQQPGYGAPQFPYGMQQPGYGQPYGYGPSGGYRPPKTNTLAIVSLVTSLLWVCGVGSLAAIICGHLGLREIDRSGGSQTGRGMAIAGLVIGYLGLISAVLYLSLVLFAVSQDGSEPINGY